MYMPTIDTPWLEWTSENQKEKIILNLQDPLGNNFSDDDFFMKQKIDITYEKWLSEEEPLVKITHTLEHTHLKKWPNSDS